MSSVSTTADGFNVSAPAGPEARSAGGPAGALDKTRTGFPLAGGSQDGKHVSTRERRAARYRLREGLRGVTTLTRFAGCGRTMVGAAVTIKNSPEAGAGFAGLMTCGSVWICPVCASKVAASRSAQLSTVLGKAVSTPLPGSLPVKGAPSYRLVMLTLTMKHTRSERLADLLELAQYGWNGLTSGRAWGKLRHEVGLFGWVRALEVTHGRHGWHPHFHVVAIVAEQDEKLIRAWGDRVYSRWSAVLARKGRATVASAFDCSVAALGDGGKDVARYVTKLSKEATMGGIKEGRGGGRSLFQVGSDAVANGDAADFAIWHEWEQTMPGKRALTWSKGLQKWGEVEDTTDEEEAAREIAGEPVVALPRETWLAVRHESWVLLDLVEDGGRDAVTAYLDGLGLAWFEPVTDDGEDD